MEFALDVGPAHRLPEKTRYVVDLTCDPAPVLERYREPCRKRIAFRARERHSPFIVFVAVLAVQWLAAYAGDALRRKMRPFKKEGERQDFDVVRAASLTLLGLIIGFTFAMAVSRYDQRKNLEEAEANAIGTEYLRANLLSADDASRVRELLKRYCDERISYYVTRDELRVGQIDADTAKLEAELWEVVERVAKVQPTPILGLVVSGMNDVLLYTGLRRGDAVVLGRQHVRNGVAILRTEKSQGLVTVTLPILPILQRTLEAGPTGKLAFICGVNGNPFTKESFGNEFREACRAAGVHGSAHGVRKIAATRAANAGATVPQLEAIFGWSGGRMASLYTQSADRKRLALDAMSKLVNEE